MVRKRETGERGERVRTAAREREREEGKMETTGDPNERGKGIGEAETLTRDKGGREGLNMGGTGGCRPTR